jgi:8-oxo-dGTP diphosphatase
VLVARRRHGHLAGKWEFPGGKLEPGEGPEQCLAREIREELGLAVRVEDIFAAVYHRYETGPILLLAYTCSLPEGWRPEADPAPSGAVRWVSAEELGRLDLAPADVPIAEKLGREAPPGQHSG